MRSYDPAVLAKAREKFLLTQEPNGVEGVLDVQEEYTEPRDVVLVGQIGGVANPWSPGKAAFILAVWCRSMRGSSFHFPTVKWWLSGEKSKSTISDAWWLQRMGFTFVAK